MPEQDFFDETEQQIKRVRWQIAHMVRTLYPGSFNPYDGSIMLDPSLSKAMYEFAYYHELTHARLARKHYGEMIQRLESFSKMAALPLNLIRRNVILELCTEKFSPTEDPKVVLKAIATDSTLRKLIRGRLASNTLFIEGLRFIEDIEKRKQLLIPHWQKTQEGGAYWMVLASLEESLTANDTENREFFTRWRSHLLTVQDYNGDGYRLVDKIACLWGRPWVSPIIHICLSPDITRVSVLRAPISVIEEQLATTKLSPDKRLEAVVRMGEEGTIRMPKPPNVDSIVPPLSIEGPYREALYELAKILDPESSKPMLTVEQFNEFWNTLDADLDFVSMMKRLLNAAGLSDNFAPIQMTDEDAKPGPLHAVIKDPEGNILHAVGDDAELLELLSQGEYSSMDKDSLITTMKREGLL
jgi:hypothetical protein